MEYSQGTRMTALYHELSPLERAIQNFEKKAFVYHEKAERVPLNETQTKRQTREREVDQCSNPNGDE